MESKYIFITNIDKLAYQHYKLILDLLKIDYKITESTEFDDCLSVYFLDEEENMLKLKAFFDLHCDVTTRYKQKMIDSGFATEEELRANRDYYMGCEREYFPDRDNTVLKNFKYGDGLWKQN